MENYPLYVAILWHMHQPYYKDAYVNSYRMPWVRLHGVKDYLDMVLILEEFPQVKLNFNLVPCLLEQINDYTSGNISEQYWELSLKPPEEMSPEEKAKLVSLCFSLNYERMIKPYRRLRELYYLLCNMEDKEERARLLNHCSLQDFRDLQVWLNLVWIDPYLRSKNPLINSLLEKGEGFSEADKRIVLDYHLEIMRQIIPTCRRFLQAGQIEITTSGYFHPILPLLYNVELVKKTKPETKLPKYRDSLEVDVETQITQAINYHHQNFGQKPDGFWPPEGAVCPELIPILAKNGIKWLATDEEILFLSLDGRTYKRSSRGELSPELMRLIYRPYLVSHEGEEISIIFRDQVLSDLIGFRYASWDSNKAVDDLISRLKHIHQTLEDDNRPYLVSIILDGENCWEHYPDDGQSFLRALYNQLSKQNWLETVKVAEYLTRYQAVEKLAKLYTGSWIAHSFDIWIGDDKDRRSWEYLFRTRKAILAYIKEKSKELDNDKIEQALKAIYIAEGSDWNWWYGDEHSSGQDNEFDALYRQHLINAFRFLGLEAPAYLRRPIVSQGNIGSLRNPRHFITPELDGRDTSYYEWFAAGEYNPALGRGSMHQAYLLVNRVYFGFDTDHLYVRIDPSEQLREIMKDNGTSIVVLFANDKIWKGEIEAISSDLVNELALYSLQENGLKGGDVVHAKMAVGEVIELAIGFEALELQTGDRVYFHVVVNKGEKELERCPAISPIEIETPDKDFEARNWLV